MELPFISYRTTLKKPNISYQNPDHLKEHEEQISSVERLHVALCSQAAKALD